MKKAVIAGATGLVGRELLNIILQGTDYQEVLILTRKATSFQHKKLVELIVDFDKLEEFSGSVTGDVLFCCLGSTKKKTPKLADYRKVDHDYPLALAKICKANGIKQYHLISAIGADMHSSNFYTKMKGETEYSLIHMYLPCLHIYQPSALSGNRQESRPLEKIALAVMSFINPLLIGGLKKYRSISAKTVAQAMYNQSLNPENGLFIHPSNHIQNLA